MARKTIEIKFLIESFNKLLSDSEILELQKETICAIAEGILERSNVKYSINKIGTTEYSREYII